MSKFFCTFAPEIEKHIINLKRAHALCKRMKSIFESGEFLNERIQDSTYRELLTESRQFSQGGVISHKTTIFLSHKHQDLEDLKGVIGLLRNKYNAQVYIDSMDDKMPSDTTGATAQRIKQIIEKSNKFILLATNNAIESAWCNWELGYGDAKKYYNHIAIFPIKPQGAADNQYKGHEYMQIYPHVTYYNDYKKDWMGKIYLKQGYYVDHGYTSIPLQEWLNK